MISKKLQFAVSFAKFSANTGIDPAALGQIIDCAKRSTKAYERNDNKKEIAYADRLEKLVTEAGCSVEWSGLWPTIIKDGQEYFLPCE